jgi:hypothetical protein
MVNFASVNESSQRLIAISCMVTTSGTAHNYRVAMTSKQRRRRETSLIPSIWVSQIKERVVITAYLQEVKLAVLVETSKK